MTKEIHHSAAGVEARTIEMQYDGFDRVVRKILKKGNTIEDDAVFTYENQMDADLILDANNQTANLGFTYNAAPPFASEGFSQLAANSSNPLQLLEEEFTVGRDVTGNIASVNGNVRGSIYTKKYDPAGRLVSVDAGGLKTAIQYDGFGRRKFLSHSDGKTQSIAYDPLNRVSQILWQENGKKSVEQYLNYDAAGNIVNMGREHSKFEFRYDQNDQLIQTMFQGMNGMPNLNRSHQYDFAGNRIKDSRSGVGDFLGNFLLRNEDSTFVADPDGRGETVEEITGDQKKVYSYRSDGKISGYQSGNLFVTYHYDAFDRLIGKSINKDGSPFTNTFVHLGDENRVLLGKAGNGEVTKYVDGQGVAERLGEVKGTSSKGYITDHLGSVLNSGAAGSARIFGSFGENSGTPSISATSPPVTYGFTGHVVDLESGLNRTQFRQYDPKIGRWLSQDPIGYLAGDLNYHRYVSNTPILLVDYYGLDGTLNTVLLATGAGITVVASAAVVAPTLATLATGAAIGAAVGFSAASIGGDVQAFANIAASGIVGAGLARLSLGLVPSRVFSSGAVYTTKVGGTAVGAFLGSVLPVNAQQPIASSKQSRINNPCP